MKCILCWEFADNYVWTERIEDDLANVDNNAWC